MRNRSSSVAARVAVVVLWRVVVGVLNKDVARGTLRPVRDRVCVGIFAFTVLRFDHFLAIFETSSISATKAPPMTFSMISIGFRADSRPLLALRSLCQDCKKRHATQSPNFAE